jgi:glutamine---fructose-6-phosphate transaminase (isomerizing)
VSGERMAAEMREQPDVLARLLERRESSVSGLRRVLPDDLRGIVLVARGSSDHAAVYGRYVIEAASGFPVALAAPSLHTLYRVRGRYEGYLAVAVSQSGRTPEIVTVLKRLIEAGACGIAVSNEADSPLVEAAAAALHLDAGPEDAVPATKTFSAQLAAFCFLAEALGQPPWQAADWKMVPEAVRSVLDDPGRAAEAAGRIGSSPGLLCVGRGYLFGIALEAALKLKETTSLLAEGFSAADLRHGPIAVVQRDFPVVTMRAEGPAAADMEELTDLLRERRADVIEIGPDCGELPFPAGLPEPLAAFPVVVRAQQLAYELALLRNIDPDRPEGLTKVTPTT